ncbi:MAG TPA: adenylate/guanylate cyclase domain-containing protein [Candidatus Limnocylindria bacterium]|nr:adenylate/guanylate cyclase domain-containing protein [Candidatus Limnocylindria bacterium]
MICPTCQTSNEPGRKFCRQCGARLALLCPGCGAANAPDDRFCGECGEALTRAGAGEGSVAAIAAATGERPGPVAERRLVSVLFADLVGFTTFAEGRDAESVRELQDRYFDTASQIIGRYGGSVEKYIGDAVMAVWGAPTAHEDDAERAVRAALDLVEGVRQLGTELGAELMARAAVVTGEAAVSTAAANQAMVSGDLVNTAARLQSVAPPGSVLVGEATHGAASEAIAFEPAGEQVLKGKVSPVTAYRALRVVARRGGAGRSEQLEAPFVGRGAELRMLKDFHAATAAERRPRLVSIMGQAGIGKSRLIWEFQKYLDGVTQLTRWHEGRSPAYGEGVTFWALAEMVRARAGVADGEDPETTRRKLAESLAAHVADEDERAWLEPRLLQLLGLESAPADGRDRESLFAAWRTFFERLAEGAVVVLVFEDLQWADEGLLDFIDHVLDWSRDRPIYIITLARPELLDRRPDWGAGRRNFTSIVLEPLSDEEMREMLAGLVPGLPESAVARILARAEGVPLYAVETVRMLLSEGRLERDNGAYRPVGDLSQLTVPPSLHALVAARLDALDPADRALLHAAAVIGKTFAGEALAAVSGHPSEDVGRRLRGLLRRELLARDADPRSPERGQYGFVQAVIREVAYGTLARRDRRRLHIAAARYFETLDDEGIAGVLAEHYLAAYRAQPEGPEGEALAAQTRVALRAAAERASALGSHRQAASYLEQALEVTSDPRERADLHAAAGQALAVGGRPDLGVPHQEKALELIRGSEDRSRVLRALVELATMYDYDGRIEEGMALLERAADEYADLAGSAEFVELIGELARANMLRGQSRRTLELADSVLDAAERLELTPTVIHLLITRGVALAQMERMLEAIAVLRGAGSLAEAHEIRDAQLRAQVNLSYAAAADDIRLSYRLAREGHALSWHLGMRGPADFLYGNAAEAAISLGEWDWALGQAEEIIGADPDSPNDIGHYRRLLILGLRGEPVYERMKALADSADTSQDEQAEATKEGLFGAVLTAQGDLAEALRLTASSYRRMSTPDAGAARMAGRLACWLGDVVAAHEALDHLRVKRGRTIAASQRELEAGIAALEGRRDEALAGFADAIRRWRDLGARFELALCDLNLVTTLGAGTPESRRAADEAREIFSELGAEPFLRMLDRALTRDQSVAPIEVRTPATSEQAETVS